MTPEEYIQLERDLYESEAAMVKLWFLSDLNPTPEKSEAYAQARARYNELFKKYTNSSVVKE